MTDEFEPLSKCIDEFEARGDENREKFILVDDVKEAIQRLKEELCLDNGLGVCDTVLGSNFNNKCNNCHKIDKVFGEELTK